jgi:hypothetical protein
LSLEATAQTRACGGDSGTYDGDHPCSSSSHCAKDGCAIASADVPGAYLEADMTKRVLMRLDKFLAEILASIDPTLRPLMKPDGTFVVVLNKALYGCIESASCGTRCCAECSRR